ncbi:MAG: ABC transporter ATP-binding protein [Bacteroidota bacterium]|nr:ABC transporter ATP-binding protein [Bacteroidota bacterium]
MNRPFKHLNKYFWQYRRPFILGVLFVGLANIFAVYQAVYVREAFNSLADGSAAANIWLFVGIIFGTAIIRGVFMYMMRQSLIVMSRNIEYDLKNEIYAQYQKLDFAFYKTHYTGDLMNRISEDVGRVRMYVGPAIMYLVNMLTMFVVVISSMFTVNPELALYVLAPLPILSISVYFINNTINKRSDRVQSKLSDLSTFVQETFSGLRVVKAFAKQGAVGGSFEKEAHDYRNKSLHLAMVDALWFPLMLLLVGLSSIFTVYIGGLKVMDGEIGPGTIAEFIIYITMLTFPVAMLGWLTSTTQRAAASQKRINEFLQAVPLISNPDEHTGFNLQNDIEFRNVSFAYPDKNYNALTNISFKINEGKALGILGHTGSGKTTIAQLLLRLMDPTAGHIYIDGKALDSVNLDQYRQSVGYVPQDVFLFSDTLRNNIAFGKTVLPESIIIQAAKDAALYDTIEAMPEGFETLIGERGITLSGGQKQRLSIARALAMNPKVLVFDDCLSAVDTQTEQQILDGLKAAGKGKMVLIVTHRPSGIMHCDEILVLDKGIIVERGTHKSLIEQGGRYAKMVEEVDR